MSNHGGKRDNAGRKPGYRKPDGRSHTVSVRLSDEELAAAERIGNGRRADGIRKAIRFTSESMSAIGA